MKKTTYINLSGMAFKIEEDAYNRLESYLNAIETRLGAEEATETLNDIESRMAEIFSAVLHSSDKTITIEDVEEVIKTLGKPDDFGSVEKEKNEQKKKSDTRRDRRLYRDTNNQVLGGVCSGLGTYFNIDPILFRILFIVGLIYGISVVTYIILWIIIPKATTIEHHAKMTAGYDKSSSRRRTVLYNNEQNSETKIFTGLRIFIGVIIVVFTSLIMFALTVTFLVSNFRIGSFSNVGWVQEISGIFLDQASSVYALIGLGIVIGIPIIMIFYAGLHLIFSFKRGGKLISLAGFLIWLVGVTFIVFASINTARQLNERTIVTQTDILQPFECDTVFLKSTPYKYTGDKMFRINELNVYMRNKRVEKDNRKTVFINKQLIVEGRPVIHIIKNAEKFAITIERESLGYNNNQAEENALHIEYFWYQKENELLMDRIFSLAEGTPVRGQRLIIKVEIPEGIHVEIEPNIRTLVR